MEPIIDQAVVLRKQGEHTASRELLFSLLQEPEQAAKAHLNIAWSYDNEGMEREAISHYASALNGPLSSTERFDALFGLACTHRGLGSYEDALGYFESTLSEYPEANEVKPFYAMCLHNLGRHQEAIEILLRLLVTTTECEAIKEYQRAILLYAADVDKKW
ncbi:tetratricopeptide repeat protein [Photobacterium sp. 2_MG-2023]|uniref:tetratricopeptide repeat protein n=1 Tax=Photobacterium sp. 2_MG-2023 TaxID=3062663 RepID=UPI0026E181AC|nr:tetratricopeptide repeat protein [Photobacterium sp. 2_MG-2023]MDO6580236.1 tetratricopeptide repeat protein [Photobacterium sp. 2_MG-2023]